MATAPKRNSRTGRVPFPADAANSAPRTWIEIDTHALRGNLAALRFVLGPRVALMATLKADAYGHGAAGVAKALLGAGRGIRPDRIAVATADEALALREAGVDVPVQTLTPLLPSDLTTALRADAAVTVHCEKEVRQLDRATRGRRTPVAVHLHVDTGMARMGCHPDEAPALAGAILTAPRLHFEGLSSQYHSADRPGCPDTPAQAQRLLDVAARLARRGVRPRYIHIANTAGIALQPSDGFNLARPGIALCGIVPNPVIHRVLNLRPAMTWKTRVLLVRDLPARARVGYGATYTLDRPGRIATLAAGYADGYRRALGNRGEVLLRGKRAPVIGRVSMDLMTVLVDHIPGVEVGDEAVLVGRQGCEEITVSELAAKLETIPHELLCGIGDRVKRTYVDRVLTVRPRLARSA